MRVREINDEMIDKFKAISIDKCETLAQTMRPIFREISESFDSGVFIESEKSEMQIPGISGSVLKKFDIHAKKIGVTTDQLLRLKLYEWLENQSDFIQSLY